MARRQQHWYQQLSSVLASNLLTLFTVPSPLPLFRVTANQDGSQQGPHVSILKRLKIPILSHVYLSPDAFRDRLFAVGSQQFLRRHRQSYCVQEDALSPSVAVCWRCLHAIAYGRPSNMTLIQGSRIDTLEALQDVEKLKRIEILFLDPRANTER